MAVSLVPALLVVVFIFISSTTLCDGKGNDPNAKIISSGSSSNAWVENFSGIQEVGLRPAEEVPEHLVSKIRTSGRINERRPRQSILPCLANPNYVQLSLGESIIFRSPNFPGRYPHNRSCGWGLYSDDPNVRFRIRCSKFRLQSPKKRICFDYLSFDNNFFYCGKVEPKNWVSTTNEVFMLFFSNQRRNFKGFSCRATAVGASSVDPTKCLSNPVVNTLPAGTSMVLTSPRYPMNYPRNEICGWYIQGEDWSVRVLITCGDFVLQDPNAKGCRDALILYQFQYCGSVGPSEWLSGTSQAAIWFSSNKRVQRKGFSCTATALDASAYGIGESTGCKCGRVNRATRIIGGQATEVNEYPWQVSFVFSDTNSSFCGGTIINDLWILTAAHCVESIDDFQVVVGGHSWSNPPASFQRLEYDSVTMHPNYDSLIIDNDLALVRLMDRLDFTDPGVSPICPPEPFNTYYDVTATVTGWGTTAFGEEIQPDELQELHIPTINNTYCGSIYTSYGYTFTDNMLCAGLQGSGVDSCQGDSGGPLITQEGDYHVLIGVVSWGHDCAVLPGVYATVANKLTWINTVASDGETCPK